MPSTKKNPAESGTKPQTYRFQNTLRYITFIPVGCCVGCEFKWGFEKYCIVVTGTQTEFFYNERQ